MLNGDLKNLSREREVHMAYYTQLTQEERYHISVLCKEGFPRAEIARRLKCDLRGRKEEKRKEGVRSLLLINQGLYDIYTIWQDR